MKRLVLIDGFSIIYRAYFAMPKLTSREGTPVNAVYGFANMLVKLVEDLDPTYLAVAFDLPQPTFRRELYIAYQGTRKTPDDDLSIQFPLVDELVRAADIAVYTKVGFEADDVIGTMAREATLHKLVDEAIVVTGDRDMMQLVNHKVKLYMPVRGVTEAKLVDENGVMEYWNVRPDQIVDLKALIGDSSDNYPGVPGVGPKTASDLLKNYDTLENIYAHVGKGEIKESVEKKLVGGRDSAILSQKLATIVTDVPINFDLEKAGLTDFKTSEKFLDKIKEFGFRSLAQRLGVTWEDKTIRTKPLKEKKNKDQMELI
jgi:DNA polymerase I